MKQNLSESHPCSWCQSKAEAQMLPLDTAFWSQGPCRAQPLTLLPVPLPSPRESFPKVGKKSQSLFCCFYAGTC